MMTRRPCSALLLRAPSPARDEAGWAGGAVEAPAGERWGQEKPSSSCCFCGTGTDSEASPPGPRPWLSAPGESQPEAKELHQRFPFFQELGGPASAPAAGPTPPLLLREEPGARVASAGAQGSTKPAQPRGCKGRTGSAGRGGGGGVPARGRGSQGLRGASHASLRTALHLATGRQLSAARAWPQRTVALARSPLLWCWRGAGQRHLRAVTALIASVAFSSRVAVTLSPQRASSL